MMKLLIDMSAAPKRSEGGNLSPQWCGKLQAKEIEAVHWSSIGPPDAEDNVLFDWAHRNGAMILTHDLGFSAIHAWLGTQTPSVVQIRSDEVDPAVIGDVIVRALFGHESALADGAIVSVDINRARVRRLPLG